MADTKISALTADATPTSDDLVVTVDGVTNKKVTLANLPIGLGLSTTDDVTFAAITGTNYTIGVVTATSTEWAFLATMDQDVTTTAGPTFAGVTLTSDVTTTGAAIDWDLIDNNAAALSIDSAGKAGILVIDTTDDYEGIIRDGLSTMTSSEALGDDASILLPTAVAGFGTVQIGDNEEYATFSFTTAGVVSLLTWSTNVINTDTDAYLCIFDNGTGIAIKNRLGVSKTARIHVHYSA